MPWTPPRTGLPIALCGTYLCFSETGRLPEGLRTGQSGLLATFRGITNDVLFGAKDTGITFDRIRPAAPEPRWFAVGRQVPDGVPPWGGIGNASKGEFCGMLQLHVGLENRDVCGMPTNILVGLHSRHHPSR